MNNDEMNVPKKGSSTSNPIGQLLDHIASLLDHFKLRKDNVGLCKFEWLVFDLHEACELEIPDGEERIEDAYHSLTNDIFQLLVKNLKTTGKKIENINGALLQMYTETRAMLKRSHLASEQCDTVAFAVPTRIRQLSKLLRRLEILIDFLLDYDTISKNLSSNNPY